MIVKSVGHESVSECASQILALNSATCSCYYSLLFLIGIHLMCIMVLKTLTMKNVNNDVLN